jgi:energy-coupling factor transport system ATP-binding protein
LDEPLAGLDPEGRADIVELLARLRDSGLTLIVISHDVEDVAAICDRTVHLRAGRIPETETAVAPVPGTEADTTPIPAVHPPGPAHRRAPGAAWRLRGGDAHGIDHGGTR